MSHLRSMTAFARYAHQFDLGTVTIEMQSTNRRFLELHFQLPRNFSSYESQLRKELSSKIGRGHVTIRITYAPHSSELREVIPNLPLAKGLKTAWEQIQQELGLSGEITLQLLASHKEELFRVHDEGEENQFERILSQITTNVLHQFREMKETEGSLLAEDLLHRIKKIEDFVAEIEKLTPLAVETYRSKLRDRLQILIAQPLEDERILKEIALYAERVDITEEIVRLRSHFSQLRSLLSAPFTDPLDTKGKKIEFLTQEMLREINTMGSKSTDERVIHLVVNSKAELEKIREQSHNIE